MSQTDYNSDGFEWRSRVPADCPFDQSGEPGRIYFTGRHSDYHCGDTIFPSWASDGNLYTPWTDGVIDGVRCSSGGDLATGFRTGHAVMIGEVEMVSGPCAQGMHLQLRPGERASEDRQLYERAFAEAEGGVHEGLRGGRVLPELPQQVHQR